MVEEIASRKSLRIEKWRDKAGHWRAGVEWFSEDNYDFICEKPTLLECLETIWKHRKEWEDENN